MFESLAPLALILIIITAGVILVMRDWRWTIAAIALQYVGVFLLAAIYWPFGTAVIKLVVGWMAAAVLGTSQIGQNQLMMERSWPPGWLFRFISGILITLLVFSVAPQVGKWLPIDNLVVIESGFALMGIGLLQLGMTANPFRASLGLLTVLAGFETLYAAVESSLLVAGLLAAINLGVALAGAYLLAIAPGESR
jgi:hypothetical protein